MDAEWGTDDCVSHALGVDFKRPHCILTETQEEAFLAAVKRYGGVDSMCAEFARRGAFRRVYDDTREVGDVIVGATDKLAFCIAKIDIDYLPLARTHHGFESVTFINIIGIWRAA